MEVGKLRVLRIAGSILVASGTIIPAAVPGIRALLPP